MSAVDREVLIRRLLGAVVLFGGLFLFSLLLPGGAPPERDGQEPGHPQRVRIDLNPVPVPMPAEAPAENPETDLEVTDSGDPEDASAAPKAESPPAEPPTPKPEPKPAQRAEPPKKQAPPQQKPPQQKPPEPSPPVSKGWWVQVASFGDAGNAERLVAKLKSSGLPARRESVSISQRTLYRVLVGPYKDKAAADAARGRVILLGFSDSRSLQR